MAGADDLKQLVALPVDAGIADGAARVVPDNKAMPRHDRLVIEERPQLPRPRRMLQLAQRLRFDLTNTFAGHAELLADFFERMIRVHADAEAHAEHALFARGERG